jgi:prevent-host-death family protein
MVTKVMSAAEFKAKCLGVLDQVAESGHGIVVTKRGRPVAQVVPVVRKPRRLFGVMKGEIVIRGDIVTPLDLEWDAVTK